MHFHGPARRQFIQAVVAQSTGDTDLANSLFHTAYLLQNGGMGPESPEKRWVTFKRHDDLVLQNLPDCRAWRAMLPLQRFEETGNIVCTRLHNDALCSENSLERIKIELDQFSATKLRHLVITIPGSAVNGLTNDQAKRAGTFLRVRAAELREQHKEIIFAIDDRSARHRINSGAKNNQLIITNTSHEAFLWLRHGVRPPDMGWNLFGLEWHSPQPKVLRIHFRSEQRAQQFFDGTLSAEDSGAYSERAALAPSRMHILINFSIPLPPPCEATSTFFFNFLRDVHREGRRVIGVYAFEKNHSLLKKLGFPAENRFTTLDGALNSF